MDPHATSIGLTAVASANGVNLTGNRLTHLGPPAGVGAHVRRWVGHQQHGQCALTVFDDGSGDGPALYAGGWFTASPAGDSYLAKWQGCPIELPCAFADLNCDGVVDVLDLLILLDAWGACPASRQEQQQAHRAVRPPGANGLCGDCPADLNGDRIVDVLDLLILLDNWG